MILIRAIIPTIHHRVMTRTQTLIRMMVLEIHRRVVIKIQAIKEIILIIHHLAMVKIRVLTKVMFLITHHPVKIKEIVDQILKMIVKQIHHLNLEVKIKTLIKIVHHLNLVVLIVALIKMKIKILMTPNLRMILNPILQIQKHQKIKIIVQRLQIINIKNNGTTLNCVVSIYLNFIVIIIYEWSDDYVTSLHEKS